MDSRQLELFVQIAGSGSLSRAAILTGVAQPRLTKVIQDLEHEVNTTLFYRTGRGVTLTDAGARLLARAQTILKQINEAKQEALTAGSGVVPNAAIAFPPSVARVFSGPIAKALSTRFPGIKLRFAESLSCYLLEWLASGSIEIAILYKSRPAQQFLFEPLLVEQLFLVASKDRPELPAEFPVKDLAGLPLIMPGTPHGLRLSLETIAAQQRTELSITVEADGLGSLIDLVGMDIGYTVLPFASVRPEIESGRLQVSPLVLPTVSRTLVLATAVNRPLSPGTREVIREIKHVVGSLSGSIGWARPDPFERAEKAHY
jgi:LysR family nitrogen assimilation transcriptional regulator